MIFSPTLNRYLIYKTNNKYLLNIKREVNIGFHYYTSKKSINNEVYYYLSIIFELVAFKKAEAVFITKNYKSKVKLNLKVRKANLDFYKFFITHYLKQYKSENVNLINNETMFLFLTKNHILIFKNLMRYDMELYEERFDEPFILFVDFKRNFDHRFTNIIC